VKDKLGNIGEIVSSTDIVIITLNGMLEDYHMFITGLATREKPATFEELTGILLQEEERQGNLRHQNSDLALWSNKKSMKWEIKRKRRRRQFIAKKTISKTESRYAI
jgi:hypothetical protein